MSEMNFLRVLHACTLHAGRMQWAMQQMTDRLPFDVERLGKLSDIDLAILDQFISRFAKLQDAMGSKLLPAILELTKEPGEFPAFIDKLNRLEKIGAIKSADEWLMLREVRNQFAHDYPDDTELQVATLNRAFEMAKTLLDVFSHVKKFAESYID